MNFPGYGSTVLTPFNRHFWSKISLCLSGFNCHLITSMQTSSWNRVITSILEGAGLEDRFSSFLFLCLLF